jgi:glycosyltransferase involved in cell wall biosynthesis
LKIRLESSNPLISIIVATYEAKNTLCRCLESIFNQNYSNVELIVIDGGSTDGTVEIIKSYSEKISYWISEPDTGIYNAWNKGLDHASGEWICFLGADDYLWSSDVLERMSPHLTGAYPEFRLVYGKVILVNADNQAIGTIGQQWQDVRRRFRQLMSVPHPGLMHHRSIFRTHGRFDEGFRIAGDYEMLLRVLIKEDALFVENITIAGMQQGGLSSTPGFSMLQLAETRIAQKKNNITRPGLIYWSAVLRVRIRQFLWILLGEGITRTILDMGRRVLGKSRYWTRT